MYIYVNNDNLPIHPQKIDMLQYTVGPVPNFYFSTKFIYTYTHKFSSDLGKIIIKRIFTKGLNKRIMHRANLYKIIRSE